MTKRGINALKAAAKDQILAAGRASRKAGLERKFDRMIPKETERRTASTAFDFATLDEVRELKIHRAAADLLKIDSPFFRSHQVRAAAHTVIDGRGLHQLLVLRLLRPQWRSAGQPGRARGDRALRHLRLCEPRRVGRAPAAPRTRDGDRPLPRRRGRGGDGLRSRHQRDHHRPPPVEERPRPHRRLHPQLDRGGCAPVGCDAAHLPPQRPRSPRGAARQEPPLVRPRADRRGGSLLDGRRRAAARPSRAPQEPLRRVAPRRRGACAGRCRGHRARPCRA